MRYLLIAGLIVLTNVALYRIFRAAQRKRQDELVFRPYLRAEVQRCVDEPVYWLVNYVDQG